MSSTGHRKFVKDYLDELIRMRSEGKTLTEMRKATGLSITSICTALNNSGCRKYTMHQVHGESEPEPEVLHYAEDRKGRIKKITAGGKRWTDVTDFYI